MFNISFEKEKEGKENLCLFINELHIYKKIVIFEDQLLVMHCAY